MNKRTSMPVWQPLRKGIAITEHGTYRVRKMVNGEKYDKCFTNKRKAIKFYNSLT